MKIRVSVVQFRPWPPDFDSNSTKYIGDFVAAPIHGAQVEQFYAFHLITGTETMCDSAQTGIQGDANLRLLRRFGRE